jgi:integral membrane sensor domain MASE1
MRSNYLAKMALLAALYMITGKLGLLLAVPPGYATIIWPASGIALGMLILHGSRLWPGVLIGSFLLNGYNSGVFAEPEWFSPKLAAAASPMNSRTKKPARKPCACGATPPSLPQNCG